MFTMANNMYEALSCSSMAESDDISVFVRQILLRSSSSSSSTLMAQTDHGMQCLENSNVMLQNQQCPVQFGSDSGRTAALAGSNPGLNSGGGYVPAAAANVSSSSVGTVDNENYEIDGYDCESEEGQVEEAPTKTAPSRSSSKRGRAAEVHNMSEKRRRCRINEKMKALQNLIPNSNKTDKASMLDEAIEYLKQLQLQVQMLTMRNGLNLHPMYLSGAANRYRHPQTKLGFYEGKGSLNMDNAAALPVDQVILPNALFSVQDPCTISKQTSVANNLSLINSGTTYGLESSRFGSFHLPGSSKGIRGEETMSFQRMNEDHPSTSLIDYHIGGAATNVKENALQAFLLGRDQSNNEHLKDLEHEGFVVTQTESMSMRRNALIKSETGYF